MRAFPLPLEKRLQISLGKKRLTPFTSQVSFIVLNVACERKEIGKDHGKVTSLVIAKEHVTFSHAWLESQKNNCKINLGTNAPIPALGFGASYFHLLPSEAA